MINVTRDSCRPKLALWFDAVNELRQPEWSRDQRVIRAASATLTPEDGGYLVPEDLAEIFDRVMMDSLTYRLAHRVELDSKYGRMARMEYSGVVEAGGFRADYLKKDVTMEPTHYEFSSVDLTTETRYSYMEVSSELEDDALVSFVKDAFEHLAYEIRLLMDYELIWGDGTDVMGGALGLVAGLGSAGNVPASRLNPPADELIKEMYRMPPRLPPRYWIAQPAWIMGQVVFTRVHESFALNGVDISSGASYPIAGYIAGFPVYLSPFVTPDIAVAPPVFFGAFDRAIAYGNRQLRLGVHNSVTRDVWEIKVIHRYDLQVFDGGDAQRKGAYLGLSTPTYEAAITGNARMAGQPQ